LGLEIGTLRELRGSFLLKLLDVEPDVTDDDPFGEAILSEVIGENRSRSSRSMMTSAKWLVNANAANFDRDPLMVAAEQ
jgi:hypothetical protein